jgi:hypothetical protein
MKLYKDSSLTEEIEIINLGICQAGDSKEYEFFIYNETEAELVDLKFSIESSEVEILSYPNKLQSKEKGTLKLKYSPALTIKKGLKVPLKYSFGEIYS